MPWWYWIVMLVTAGTVVFTWFMVGPGHPLYALAVASWTWGLLPGMVGPAVRILPHSWFRVSTSERIVHRLLGVGIFAWFLDHSGYNRYIARPLRKFSGTKAGLASLGFSLRTNAGAHGVCFAIHILLASVALLVGHPRGALWVLLPGVVIHLYPVLLQRSIMLRIQPLLIDRTKDTEPSALS